MDNNTKSEETNSIEEHIEEVISTEDISWPEKVVTVSSDGENQVLDLGSCKIFEIDHESLQGSTILQHFEAKNEEENVCLKKIELPEKNDTFLKHNTTTLRNEKVESFFVDVIDECRDVLRFRSLNVPNAKSNVEYRKCCSLGSTFNFSVSSEIEGELKAASEPNSKHKMSYGSVAILDSNVNEETKMEKSAILCESDKTLQGKMIYSDVGDADIHMGVVKPKILSLDDGATSIAVLHTNCVTDGKINPFSLCKSSENIAIEFNTEVLENITEKSNKSILIENDNTSNDFDSIVSLNMIQALENKIEDLQDIAVGKDACLASLNVQLESFQRKQLYGMNDIRESSKELPPSGRDSSSLITSSTDYKILQDDCGNRVLDFHNEIVQRDTLIDKLTVSLQQSMNIRDQLQQQGEKLSTEVQHLRKQLSETLDAIKRPYWPRYQESIGQRLSEVSIDLVSESDDDLDRQFLTDADEKVPGSVQNSNERQIIADHLKFGLFEPNLPVTKQIEQFQNYLNSDELGIFLMIKKKFDNYLSQEIQKSKAKHDSDLKAALDKLRTDAMVRELEVSRLQQLLVNVKDGSTELDQLRQELVTIHSQEMENLRTYFEKKCADLEKHYSEEIFSLKSQRDSVGSSSDDSDPANFPEECSAGFEHTNSKTRIYEELHPNAVMPGSNVSGNSQCKGEKEPEISTLETRNFYQDKIREITLKYEETIKKLSKRLKKYESKFADDEFMVPNVEDVEHGAISSNFVTDQEDINNECQEICKIAAEYERRLWEQVSLAKEDLVRELETQIQALLSESTIDDHHWPPELILLREKFTAKSQLEIAQLQMKHEEEMSRLKNEFERQLTRKMKRNSTFDLSRDLDQIITERNNLRELSNTLRRLLCELVKCVNFSESKINSTLLEEICKTIPNPHDVNPHQENWNVGNNTGRCSEILNISIEANQHILSIFETRSRLIPNTTAILSLIENPSLIEFVTSDNYDFESFNLRECLERLKTEANHLLQLSESIFKNKKGIGSTDLEGNSCEEDDGLQSVIKNYPDKELRTEYLSDSILANNYCLIEQPVYNSLPSDLRKFFLCNKPDERELRNGLEKSEADRQKLQEVLNATIKKKNDLAHEVNALRMQLEQWNSHRENLCEGYGTKHMKSTEIQNENCTKSLPLLQEKARNFLSTTCKPVSLSSSSLLQLIEDFCRESDKVLEEGKKDKIDLQSQIDAADKQLKATRQFLEDQAAERELERDEFVKEMERLKLFLREKEKDRAFLENVSKEAEQMEKCISDHKQKIANLESRKDTLQLELKASIDKIFVLREIISELETQIETKSLSEHVLVEKVKELEACLASQAKANVDLQNEVESLKSEFDLNYVVRETVLRDQWLSDVAQEKAFEGVFEQLKEVENTLDNKIKNLESLHQGNFSNSCSVSHSEDVSFPLPKSTEDQPNHDIQQDDAAELDIKTQRSVLVDTVQRVIEKLAKHARIEEAAFKKFSDLEANFGKIRTTCTELQDERDDLQERMTDQQSRILSLQSKLDEQRHRADEIQRQGTSEFMIKIHDMKNEIFNLKETLSSRDKQLSNLKNQLEQSRVIIDRQEAELSLGIGGDKRDLEKLEAEHKRKVEEIEKLKERIKNDMINKLALPDLMETMLADKNEEIDHLKERLETKELELKSLFEKGQTETEFKPKHSSHDQHEAKLSARTLSDIGSISECDEPDAIRKAAYQPERSINFTKTKNNNLRETLGSLKDQPNTTPGKTQYFPSSTYFQSLHKDASSSTALCVPRVLNFSDFSDTENCPTNHSPSHNVLYSDVDYIDVSSSTSDLEKKLEVAKNSNKPCPDLQTDTEFNRLSFELNEKKELLKSFQKEHHMQPEPLHSWGKKLERKNDEIDCPLQSISSFSHENISLQTKIQQMAKGKSNEHSQQVKLLEIIVLEKDEVILKLQKDVNNYMQNEKLFKQEVENLQKEIHNYKFNSNSEKLTNLKKELDSVRTELSEKVLMYDKCMLDLEAMEIEINSLRSDIDKGRGLMSECQEMLLIQKRFEEIKQKLLDEEKRRIELENCNIILEVELEKLRAQNSDPKPFSLDEITEKVEKELNYSAQLDSNILKAIESEEENTFSNKLQNDVSEILLEDTCNQFQVLQSQLNVEKENCDKMSRLLNEEKKRWQEIQQQDADVIEAMRLQLQIALDKETELYNVLDAERQKCERLITQMSIMQRTEARKSSWLLKSPPDSPKNVSRSSKSGELELDIIERYKNETKLLKSQIEREKDRVFDLQKALEREKKRSEVELNERIEYAEKLKEELEKICHEKELLIKEVQHLRERLVLGSREIESLEGRISILQEAETRRIKRRDCEREETASNTNVLYGLKLRNANLEQERDHLNQTIHVLRCDLERGAQREARFAEALVNTGVETNVPQKFLQKLKEMNYLLIENTMENKQMAETLRHLTVDRKDLQKRCEELEYASQSDGTTAEKLKELEERANHLFVKYLRVESHRKALVHQKRYLLIVLQTYQDNEARALQLLNGDKKRKHVSFKSVALIVVAIQRMKFIVKRWQTGKKVVSKSIVNLVPPKNLQLITDGPLSHQYKLNCKTSLPDLNRQRK